LHALGAAGLEVKNKDVEEMYIMLSAASRGQGKKAKPVGDKSSQTAGSSDGPGLGLEDLIVMLSLVDYGLDMKVPPPGLAPHCSLDPLAPPCVGRTSKGRRKSMVPRNESGIFDSIPREEKTVFRSNVPPSGFVVSCLGGLDQAFPWRAPGASSQPPGSSNTVRWTRRFALVTIG